MDWGEADDWEVDKKAERLNKSLFGKPIKGRNSIVKSDTILDDSQTSHIGRDSDDDGDDEKLSKKAKKKLKERKRRENKRNKQTASTGQSGEEGNDEKDDVNQNKKDTSKEASVKIDKKKSVKNKQKLKDKNILPSSKEILDKSSSIEITNDENKEKSKRKRNQKRKNSSNGNKEEGEDVKKRVKENGLEKLEDGGDEMKKKRKRHRKKKPNSKKNKYKHLGLKSKSVDLDETMSDSDEGQGKSKPRISSIAANKVNASQSKAVSKNVNNYLKPNEKKGKKRQLSVSPVKSQQAKKMKLVDESGKIPALAKSETKKQELLSSRKTEKEIVSENGDSKTSRKSKKDKKSKLANNDADDLITKATEKQNKESVVITKATEKQNKESVKENGKDGEEKRRKKKKKSKKENGVDDSKGNEMKSTVSPFLLSGQGSDLQQKVTDKLASARFRFINEQLYTIKGGEAFRMFQQDKTLMNAYNTGFQGQAKQWSVNPLDVIIKQIGTKSSNLVVADFGCGEARLSSSVKQKVHSFDLYPLNKRITVCDMSKTSLASGSVDIAVFCLSLMGTNLNDYLVEANRVLKDGGLLKIAEVVSRFTNVNHFIKAVMAIGFKSLNTRELSTMFYLMDFKKVKTVEKLSKSIAPISLKPCVYKKR